MKKLQFLSTLTCIISKTGIENLEDPVKSQSKKRISTIERCGTILQKLQMTSHYEGWLVGV